MTLARVLLIAAPFVLAAVALAAVRMADRASVRSIDRHVEQALDVVAEPDPYDLQLDLHDLVERPDAADIIGRRKP